MNKKHFIALADAIREVNKQGPEENPYYFDRFSIEMLADFCARQNPDFKRQRWIDYIAGKCGPNGGDL